MGRSLNFNSKLISRDFNLSPLKKEEIVNSFIETVWDAITDNPELIEELTTMMGKDHKPFLSTEQSFQANAHMLKQHMLDKLTRWVAWLPTFPIDQLGRALAEEAFEAVDWNHRAELVKERVEHATTERTH